MNGFGKVYSKVLCDNSVSLNAKAIYAILTTFADKDGVCWPSIGTLIDVSGVSQRTIYRAITELTLKNYVRREGKRFILYQT